MKVPRLHVGAFPLLLLSLMASTSTCVEGKCSSFFLLQASFEELHCDDTSDVENSSTDDFNCAS